MGILLAVIHQIHFDYISPLENVAVKKNILGWPILPFNYDDVLIHCYYCRLQC